MRKFKIAIDGYSSTGKSTLARELAKALHFLYIDSGAMYRAVTLFGMRAGLVTDEGIDEEALVAALDQIKITFLYNRTEGRSETLLNGENVEAEIRTLTVSNFVSPVSAIPTVREKCTQLQRKLGEHSGVVMDGRDIGTVIFPDARLKLFMTADTKRRAERRYDELTAKGQSVTIEDVEANLLNRDRQDTTRKTSPLKQAEDAIVIDNTEMTQQEQLELALHYAIRVMATPEPSKEVSAQDASS